MGTITSANSSLLIGVTDLIAAPQPMQGYDVDDAFDGENVDVAETKMGVDGKLSAGWVNETVKMAIVLQADSDSVTFFETWYAAEKAAQDKFFAFGILRLQSVGKSYALARGVLKGYSPFPSGKKVLQPRRFAIEWESVIPAPIA